MLVNWLKKQFHFHVNSYQYSTWTYQGGWSLNASLLCFSWTLLFSSNLLLWSFKHIQNQSTRHTLNKKIIIVQLSKIQHIDGSLEPNLVPIECLRTCPRMERCSELSTTTIHHACYARSDMLSSVTLQLRFLALLWVSHGLCQHFSCSSFKMEMLINTTTIFY